MYAIIEDGGKQYKVSEGEAVLLERKDIEPGGEVEFDRVLLLSKEGDVRVGAPVVEGAKVAGVVQGEKRGKKVVSMSFRRRKGSKVKKGHRQNYTSVLINKIEFPG